MIFRGDAAEHILEIFDWMRFSGARRRRSKRPMGNDLTALTEPFRLKEYARLLSTPNRNNFCICPGNEVLAGFSGSVL
jgi:hypothetical protein